MLLGVNVEHHVHERAHEARAATAIHDEARTADLCPAGKVDHAELFTLLPVRHDGSTRRSWYTPTAHDGVGRFVTLGNIGERDVGQLVQHDLHRRLGFRAPLLEDRDVLSDGPADGHQFGGVFARLAALPDFGRDLVPTGLLGLELGDGGAALPFERFRAVEQRTKFAKFAAPAHALAEVVELVAQQPNVMHAKISSSGYQPSARGIRNCGLPAIRPRCAARRR